MTSTPIRSSSLDLTHLPTPPDTHKKLNSEPLFIPDNADPELEPLVADERDPSPCPTRASVQSYDSLRSVDTLERQGIPRIVHRAHKPQVPWADDLDNDYDWQHIPDHVQEEIGPMVKLEEAKHVDPRQARQPPRFLPVRYKVDQTGRWYNEGKLHITADHQQHYTISNFSRPLSLSKRESTVDSDDLVVVSPTHARGLKGFEKAPLQPTRQEVQDKMEREDEGNRQERQGSDGSSLREISPGPWHKGSRARITCTACGCTCKVEMKKVKGSGSTTLSNAVRGNILQIMLGKESLYSWLRRDHPEVQSWADIAAGVDAQREDFDRVRHAARWFRNNLPILVRRVKNPGDS
ncbi:hypothetical protein M231_07057 [Tremella mesenterica]|uniref:Uncharacterized protein n=1 Tax=Tremella mesenterica TaxID=5217 RepID=A0A4Q1BD26_TREME|nr:hypothetical protein M231_07057 [Tremella mesenterica]